VTGAGRGWWCPAAAPDRARLCLVPTADQPGFVCSTVRNRVHGRAESLFSLVLFICRCWPSDGRWRACHSALWKMPGAERCVDQETRHGQPAPRWNTWEGLTEGHCPFEWQGVTGGDRGRQGGGGTRQLLRIVRCHAWCRRLISLALCARP